MEVLTRWPLRTTIPLLLLVSTFVIGTFTWTYNVSLKNEEIEREAQHDLAGKMTSMQRRLNDYFRQNNIEGIQKEISTANYDRNIINAFLIDEHNRIISATRLAMKGKIVATSAFGASDHQNIVAHLKGLKEQMSGSVELSRDRQTIIGYSYYHRQKRKRISSLSGRYPLPAV